MVFFDENLKQYVYYGRTHQRGASPPCPPGTQKSGRTIGRLVLGKTVVNWPTNTADHVPTIFSVDELDAPCMDIYCNGATPYAGVYLMFPVSEKSVRDSAWFRTTLLERTGSELSQYGSTRSSCFGTTRAL